MFKLLVEYYEWQEPNRKDDFKNNPNLRTGYLYTNYKRDDVKNSRPRS